MVIVSFSVPKLKPMVLNGTKQQTIRLMNKKWINAFDKIENFYTVKLQLYWKQRSPNNEKLMEVECKSIQPIKLSEITLEIAKADGFETLDECLTWFKNTYKKVDFETQYLALIKW